MPISLPAVEAFPTSLSVVYAAKLDKYLDSETVLKLQQIEDRLNEHVDFGPILRARTNRGLEKSLIRASKAVAEYYVESGVLIWRALDHDYGKLLRLSQASCSVIDELFFQNARRLERETFINAVAGIRIFEKVGEWVITSYEASDEPEQPPPMDYLNHVMIATFFTSCLLAYVSGEVSSARRENIRKLAEAVFDLARESYEGALNVALPEKLGAVNAYYWSPDWQQEEVEAELDKRLGYVKSFASVENLLRDLHG
jgi:hypothetical protein